MISYKYKLYTNKNTKYFDSMLSEACYVWNHALALQKKYYKLYGKYVSAVNMQKHFAKRIKRTFLHSQSVQEILQRRYLLQLSCQMDRGHGQKTQSGRSRDHRAQKKTVLKIRDKKICGKGQRSSE